MAGATHGRKGHKAGHSCLLLLLLLLLLDSHHLGSSFVQVGSRYHEVGKFKAGSAVKGKVKTPKNFNQKYPKKNKNPETFMCVSRNHRNNYRLYLTYGDGIQKIHLPLQINGT